MPKYKMEPSFELIPIFKDLYWALSKLFSEQKIACHEGEMLPKALNSQKRLVLIVDVGSKGENIQGLRFEE